MFLEKENLKNDLKKIKSNNYELGDKAQATYYLELMLKYIGDPDAELRDDLVYTVFDHWIEDKKYFSNSELVNLLNKLTSNDYLFYKIGSVNDDTALKRSFSALFISVILWDNRERDFLNIDTILKIQCLIIKYFDEEKDYRGYSNEIGWVHTLAHSADVMHALLNSHGINKDFCKQILLTVENKLLEGKDFLSAEEDERLVNIIYYDIIQDKLLETNYICNWISGLSRVLEIQNRPTRNKARTNIKNLIRSLYFRMLHIEMHEKICISIIELEKKLNVYAS